VTDLHYLLDILDKYNVKFKSVTEVFDTTSAMGRFFITLVGAMAQWERENLAERVRVAQEQKALKGERIGAVAPYGYRIDENGKLAIKPEEARIVRRIFNMYKRVGKFKIAEALNKEKIPTRTGGKWSEFTIWYILKNPTYCGKLRWGYRKNGIIDEKSMIVYDGDHEPIISVETFEEIQRIAKRRGEGSPKAATSEYPYSGVLHCARCGYAMIGKKRKFRNGYRYYYRCSGRDGRGVCDMHSVAEESVDQALLESLNWMVEDLQTKEEETNQQDTNQRIKEIEREIKALKNRRKKWQFLFAEDVITIEELRERIDEDRNRIAHLEAELKDLSSEKTEETISKEELLVKVQDLKAIWKYAERIQRKEIVHGLFKHIAIDGDNSQPYGHGKFRPVKIVSYEFVDF